MHQIVAKFTKSKRYIEHFNKGLIPKEFELAVYASTADGGVPGYSTNGYLGSINPKTKETKTNICGGKSRISKRTIPCNETISRALQGDYSKMVIQVLSHRPAIRTPRYM